MSMRMRLNITFICAFAAPVISRLCLNYWKSSINSKLTLFVSVTAVTSPSGCTLICMHCTSSYISTSPLIVFRLRTLTGIFNLRFLIRSSALLNSPHIFFTSPYLFVPFVSVAPPSGRCTSRPSLRYDPCAEHYVRTPSLYCRFLSLSYTIMSNKTICRLNIRVI